MNTTLTKPKSKQAKIFAIGGIAGAKANNKFFDNKEVPFVYRNHYVNTKTGVNGIENLIIDILQKHCAVFATNVASTPLRNMAICQAMFISEIITCVRNEFGFDRYPDATIYTVVSVLMVKSGLVAKIAL